MRMRDDEGAVNLLGDHRLAGQRRGDKRDLTGRLWPADDVHQLTLALLDGEYASVTTTSAVLAQARS